MGYQDDVSKTYVCNQVQDSGKKQFNKHNLLQGLRCEWGAGVLNLVLSLSLSHTGHWKFNMAPHGKELAEDLKKRYVALRAATIR